MSLTKWFSKTDSKGDWVDAIGLILARPRKMASFKRVVARKLKAQSASIQSVCRDLKPIK